MFQGVVHIHLGLLTKINKKLIKLIISDQVLFKVSVKLKVIYYLFELNLQCHWFNNAYL